MRSEGMGHEEERRLEVEISRAKSDIDLLKEGAEYTEKRRLDISDRTHERIETEAVDVQSKIEKLSSQEFEKSMKSLEEEVLRMTKDYEAVRPYIIRKSKLGDYLVNQLGSDEGTEDSTYNAQYKIDAEEAKSVSYQNQLNSAEYLVETIIKFADKYRLYIPATFMKSETVIESFPPDRLLQMVIDARDAELYRAHEALGK